MTKEIIGDTSEQTRERNTVHVNHQRKETGSTPRCFDSDIGLWPELPTQEMMDFWAKKQFTELKNCGKQLFEGISTYQEQTQGEVQCLKMFTKCFNDNL